MSARPVEWQRLVSARQLTSIVSALSEDPQLIDALRGVLMQLSPRLGRSLLANLDVTPRSEDHATHAAWTALAITGHEVKLCSAEALGSRHVLGDDPPGGELASLQPTP